MLFRLPSRAFSSVIAGLTTWMALLLTHRIVGAAWSIVVGVTVGCAIGLVGPYLFGRLEPLPDADDKSEA